MMTVTNLFHSWRQQQQQQKKAIEAMKARIQEILAAVEK